MTASIVTDMRIDPDRLMLTEVDTSKAPLFTVSEMAKFFFARTNHWVRSIERNQKMIFTDEDGSTRTVGLRRTAKGARVYTLSDIEEIAHALAQNGVISGSQLRHSLLLIKVQAQMNDYL